MKQLDYSYDHLLVITVDFHWIITNKLVIAGYKWK